MSQDQKGMSYDQFGGALATENRDVVEAVNRFTSEFLYLGKQMGDIVEVVKKYPHEMMLHLLAAIFYLSGQTLENQKKAGQHLDEASHLLDSATEREKSLFEMAEAWQHLALAEALKCIEKHCFKWPKDLMAIKIAEFLFHCKGQKYESKRFLRLTSYCDSEHKNDPFLLSMHAFALGLNEKLEEALSSAQRALQLNARNPYAHHTLAYIYLKKGSLQEGIELLEHYDSLWQQVSHRIASHHLWLLALFYLENLDFDQVQEVYKRADWSHPSHDVSEEMDAASLLWRLDLEGLDDFTLPLWKELADAIRDHANFVATPFLSAQLCYALCKGNKDNSLKEALEHIEHFVHTQVKEDRFVWKDIGLACIQGALAFANKKYDEAVQYFHPIMENIDCVGGNDIQVNLFRQTYLKSLIRGGHHAQAESFLHSMTQGRDLNKLERKWLAECQ